MVVFGDGCVGCGLPCLGDNCIYKNVISCTCDKCKQEFDAEELYEVDGEDLCANCILMEYRTVWDRLMDD